MKATRFLLGATFLLAFLSSLPAQAQIAEGKCRFLGNIIGGSGNAPSNFSTYWDQVTPENAGKWGSVESTRDNMNWGAMDNIFNYAKSQQIPFKAHNFVWDNQQPSWLSALSPEEQKAEVEEWIQQFCERYQGEGSGWPGNLPFYVDVVNEPINDPAFYNGALGGAGTTGYDWIIWTFEKAREYCPNAELLINEYNILNGYTSTATYLQIINLLNDRGLIDGIGVQGHSLEDTDKSTIKTALDALAATELPIFVSEYEVRGDDATQLTIYKDQFPMLWSHKSVHGITLWGYIDGQMWRNEGHLVKIDQTERPAMAWLKDYVKGAAGGTFCSNGVTPVEDGPRVGSAVYPNPVVNNRATFALNDAGPASLVITDVQGREIGDWKLNGPEEVNLELNVAPGIYFVQLKGVNSSVGKIVVR